MRIKKIEDVSWTDNLEISEELEVCQHDNIEEGQCTNCGRRSIDIYDEMYNRRYGE